MDTVELESNDEQVETFPDQPGLATPNGIYDEPVGFPRIGKQYQVEIPVLRTKEELAQQKGKLTSIENTPKVQNDFGTGLAVPIRWAYHDADAKVDQTQLHASGSTVEAGSVDWGGNKKNPVDAEHSMMHEFLTKNALYHGTHLQKSAGKAEANLADNDKEFEGSTSQELRMPDNKMDEVFSPEEPREVSHHRPLPGSSSILWSDDEIHCFLLGLYIFGKNLVQVRDFTECKSMGDILTFYYGKFYGSDAYRKWSECRKIKSRRRILGQRIFTGWRQQELLSRVFATVSEDVQDVLLEATKMFTENKTSFEEYVTTLKIKAGLKVLVDAVAIGKGKQDLTGAVLDPNRLHQVIPIRPEIPIGKACSSLSAGDIIKFLTGGFRLSKARSNDLFWEAVWPRLLARGWHSEQPKDVSVGSKHALVFIIPGVKKFSRKRLVKGNHYFDSVSDVMSKVASDPRLLELEAEGSRGGSPNKDDNGWPMEQNGLPNHLHQCYHQPSIPNCNSELMKFTVIDTSLVVGEEPLRVRELRSLPLEVANAYISLQNIGESTSTSSEQDLHDNSLERGDSASRPSDDAKLEQRNVCTIDRDPLSLLSDAVAIVSSASSQINGHKSNDHFSGQVSANPLVKDVHSRLRGRSKPDKQNDSAPIRKRKRLTACKNEGTSRRAYPFSRSHQQTEMGSHDSAALAKNDIVADSNTSLGNIHQNYSMNRSLDEKTRSVSTQDCHISTSVAEATFCSEKPQSHAFIDLNLIPHGSLESEGLPVPPEYGGEHLKSEVVVSHLDANPKEAAILTKGTQHEIDPEAMEISAGLTDKQLVSENSRRQSTRNRPPTTRALEALACGFIGAKRRGRDNMVNRPSQRMRKTVETPPSIRQPNADTCSASFQLSNPVADEKPEDASALNKSISHSEC